MTHNSKCEQADGSHGCMCADRLQVSARHTPGPWSLEIDGWASQSIYGYDTQAGCEIYIADISLSWDSAAANARLIAAAPELLEALESIHALALDQTITLDMDHDLKGCIDNIIDEARAAITKAKGAI